MKLSIVIPFFLFASQVFSQSLSVEVFLKNKLSLSSEAVEIRSNGFLNEEQVFLYFKVIDSLHVYDNEITSQFVKTLEGEIITQHPGFSTVDLKNCTYPVILPRSGRFFSNTIAGVSVSNFYRTLAGFHLDSELVSRPNMFLRLDFSTGFATKQDIMLSSYNLGGAVGIKLPIFLKPQGFIGFGAFSSTDLIDEENTQYRIYINGAIEMDVYGVDWISVTAGLTTFMMPVKVDGKDNTVNYSAGINFNLTKF
ncbi:MAG: hypothetical protein J0L62_13225 [Bacteroidetes bacterium]|nr:hypothetical protein [Bacteroidota bacterium]